MSKKKAFSGNTMTLKDFHGGSIPTDLPLPSAPGVTFRPTDRAGYDRGASWGNPVGRSDHRSRPNSSPSIRHFDDKTPFLTQSQTAHIGRNFDEDERKPLDGVSAPRRTFSDESFRVQPIRSELKQESTSGWAARVGSVSQSASGTVHSYSGRTVEQTHVSAKSPSLGGIGGPTNGPVVHGSYTNAWTARKEVAVEPVQPGWSGESVVSKLAHASALEKVSSGRWQSKQSVQYHADVEVADAGSHLKGYNNNVLNRVDMVVQKEYREYPDAALSSLAERRLNVEDMEVKERKLAYTDRVQLTRPDGKYEGPVSQPLVRSEASERPKLKLLPRTKPLESSEYNVDDLRQGYYRSSVSANGRIGTANDMHGNMNPAKPGLVASDGARHAVEHPKLNLKPHVKAPEKLEGNVERERISVFGGARPRELVLKERGVDNATINNQDLVQHSDRVKHDTAKNERVHNHGAPRRQTERTENIPLDQRGGRKFERKDLHVDSERADLQRRNWRNENRRNGRETERRQQQQLQERHPSPETWRKPVEEPKPAAVNSGGTRHGKAASALELAQAFSRSFSDPKLDDRYSGHRGLGGRTQMPFSRLMGPSPRPQINGY